MRVGVVMCVGAVALAACASSAADSRPTVSDPPASSGVSLPMPTDPATTHESTTSSSAGTTLPPTSTSLSPGADVYAHTGVGQMSPAVANALPYVYVPSNDSGTVTVIDQRTFKIVTTYTVGRLPQHVVAGWDLRTLYATASDSNRLVEIDPTTGAKGKVISVAAPYNLYFTPDGTTAIVMAERLQRMDFYDRLTWKLRFSVHTPCKGVNHADWSSDGSWFLVTCEFSGDVLKVDTATGAILGKLALPKGAMPQDLRLAPDGNKFYVADMEHGCLWIIGADGLTVIGSIKTGKGAHGIYPSRDAKFVYVTNRGRTNHDTFRRSRPGEGSISVVDPVTDTVVATWAIPGGGSPDMGGVSADGTQLWVAGRYDSVVYVFDTRTGNLLATIKVPPGPHGLCLFPQPGRYSLGHTGNYR